MRRRAAVVDLRRRTHQLEFALRPAGGRRLEIVADNFRIALRGEGIDRARFVEALERLRDPAIWEAERWDEIASLLPSYRLSKFQPFRPPWVEREVIATALLDIPGARHWIDARTL